jgi:hypothetical protein
MHKRFTSVAASAAFAAAAVLAMSPADLSFAQRATSGAARVTQTSPPLLSPSAHLPGVQSAASHTPLTAPNLPPALKGLKIFHSAAGAATRAPVSSPPRQSTSKPGTQLHMLMGSSPPSSEIVLTPDLPVTSNAAIVAYNPYWYTTSYTTVSNGYIRWTTSSPGIPWGGYYKSFAVNLYGRAGKSYVIDVAISTRVMGGSCHILVGGPDGLSPTIYPCLNPERDNLQHVRFVYVANEIGGVYFDVGAENYGSDLAFYSATIDEVK